MKTLLASLSHCAVETSDGLEARPRSSREVLDVVNALRDAQARLGETVRLSRIALQDISGFTPEHPVISVGAGVSLGTLETSLNARGVSLGVLPRDALRLTMAEFLEGPLAGRRLLRGGLTEAICNRADLVTAEGRLFTAGSAAREGAGPDLMALALGGYGRLALVTRAEVRCVPMADLEASMTFEFADARAAVEALRDALDDEAFVTTAQLGAGAEAGERRLLRIDIQGSRTALARDRSAVYAAVRRHAGTEARTPLPAVEGPGHVTTWSALLHAGREMPSGTSLLLERTARNSLVISGISLESPHASFPEGLTNTFDPQDIMERHS